MTERRLAERVVGAVIGLTLGAIYIPDYMGGRHPVLSDIALFAVIGGFIVYLFFPEIRRIWRGIGRKR